MVKATTYSFQGKEWTVKDLAEELGLSTHRVYRLLKDHNEDLKAIFESRGITIKEEEKSQRARLFDYKGKQWTVKQLAEEFGLSYARVNHLIRQYDGDVEQIALSRKKDKKTSVKKTDEITKSAKLTTSQSQKSKNKSKNQYWLKINLWSTEHKPKDMDELIEKIENYIEQDLDTIGTCAVEICLMANEEEIDICVIAPGNTTHESELLSANHRNLKEYVTCNKLNNDFDCLFEIKEEYLKKYDLSNDDNFENNFTKILKIINS